MGGWIGDGMMCGRVTGVGMMCGRVDWSGDDVWEGRLEWG